MVRKPNLSIEDHGHIISGYNEGLSPSLLARQFSVSRPAIYSIIRRNRENGGVKKKCKRGRPVSTSEREDKIICRLSKKNPRLNSVDIHREMSTYHGFRPSSKTVQRRLVAAGLHGRRPAKKPLISIKNRKARVEFAKRHIGWQIEDWKKVIFSDESKFLLFGSDGIKYVRRPIGKKFDPRYQLPTVKHSGGNVKLSRSL